jgi:hypothetical protein
MARKIATVKATGGSGFQFANTVAAVCLVRMLDGKPVFGLREYRPLEISFETRVGKEFPLHTSGRSCIA